MIRLYITINHTPWVPARVTALAHMLDELLAGPGIDRRIRVHSTDYRGRPWQAAKVDWALAQWEGAFASDATHCVFATDDLHLAPGFIPILHAMIEAHPDELIGLLSNHPKGPALAAQGCSGYYTNSWLVGPAYVLPRETLRAFLGWFRALPDGPFTTPGTKAFRNDDSSINEWITNGGGPGRCWHPLPTTIEHRWDIPSTAGHGDRFSCERISWRATRHVVEEGGRLVWHAQPRTSSLTDMREPGFWAGHHPMLPVVGQEEDDGRWAS